MPACSRSPSDASNLVTGDDVGFTLRVRVTTTNDAGTVSGSNEPTEVVTNGDSESGNDSGDDPGGDPVPEPGFVTR